jgi:molybdate transport system permease protein
LPLVALVWRGASGGGLSPEGLSTLRQALGLSLGDLGRLVRRDRPLRHAARLALARRRFAGARAVDLLIDLPIVLPPSVAGIALLLAFGRFGLFGAWLSGAGITVGFTTVAVVLAQTFVAAPFYVRAAAGAFRRIDRDLEERRPTSAPRPGERCGASPCRWHCPPCWPGRCSPGRGRSASSAPPSCSPATSRA